MKPAKASFTIAWRTCTGSGPSLRTFSSISPGRSTVRSTASSSTGTPLRSSPGASSATNSPMATAEQRERQQPREPAPEPARRRGAVAGLHQSTTSKKPIQPRSANSLTWAWNMYLPVYGKRSSRMPRSPCPWMTVSVKSRGSSFVPVG